MRGGMIGQNTILCKVVNYKADFAMHCLLMYMGVIIYTVTVYIVQLGASGAAAPGRRCLGAEKGGRLTLKFLNTFCHSP